MSKITVPSWLGQWLIGLIGSALLAVSTWTLSEVISLRLELTESKAVQGQQIDFLYEQGADHETRIRTLERGQ